MAAGWERAIARVLDGDNPEGAAFLIAGGHLLTCAYVVARVAGLAADEPLPVGHPVTVDFPLSAQAGRVEASVCFSSPIGDDMTGDVAVLRLADDSPADAMPLRLVAADGLAGHRWRAFGFPAGRARGSDKDAGVWCSGVIEGREGTGWWQLTADAGAAFPLARGFSGGPVWDEQYGGVVGIIVAAESDVRLRTGYALTVDAVEREWPTLREALPAGNPYQELAAFTENQASVFYGRELETRRLIELVENDSMAIVPVLGTSGVGKSSVVAAGLISHLLESGRYIIARIPHGVRYTAEELVAWALTSTFDGGDESSWRARWRSMAVRLADGGNVKPMVDQLLAGRPRGTRLMMVVDQFEGLVVDTPQVASRLDSLLGVLTELSVDGARSAQAVVVTRIDFLRHLAGFPHITAAWDATHLVIPPMTRDQLREVAAGPLSGLGGVRFADGLLERMLHDTPSGPAALPLLEYALAQLWQRQDHGELTTWAYHELGCRRCAGPRRRPAPVGVGGC